uniref:Chalcone synthase n=1 Tax=Oryza punctata TaxID=4537 RepID=A0A0E0KZS5_ORYPU
MPGAATAAVVDTRLRTQHAEGPAAVLAIGTANPANIVYQDGFADYYFGLTKSEDLTELKDKMKRICKQIYPSTSTVALSIILSTCAELTLICFSTPDESKIVGHGLFGDGAGAIIVGAGPLADGECPLFEMVLASQTTIPGTEHALGMQTTGSGIDFHLSIQVPKLIKDNIQQCLLDTFRSVGNMDPNWNDLFWAVHPGGRAILDNIEGELQLQPAKLAASRHVLSEYGNMSGTTIAFVLDDLRRRREKEGYEQQQYEWGVMLAFGPGITIEAMVLPMPGAATAAVVDTRLCTQHAEGPAAVLAIGTANPANIIYQDGFADYYFGLTKSHRSGIEKRYIHLDEKLIHEHPEIIDKHMPSLETRVDIVTTEVPKLAESAARKAIVEWGRPVTDITHLIFSTYSGCSAPSADLKLASLLNLNPSVSRTILSLHGCSGGGRALQLAKELAENNRDARVLIACAELTLICFSTPDESKIVGHGLFGDGAGAIIVGAGPLADGECPLFEMVLASQTTIPGTEHALGMQTTGSGIDFHLSIQVPKLIKDNIQQCLLDTFRSVGNKDPNWNDLFWAVHPGGRAILDNIEGELQLQPAKLAASRHVLSEYGNMSGTTIAFVLDDLRRRREKEGDEQQQHEWGVMLAFGPGITIEAMVLRNPLS